MIQRKRWEDLQPQQRAGITLLGMVQFSLLIAALVDIRRRPASQIRGSKRLWTALSFINFVGPIGYFVFGRQR